MMSVSFFQTSAIRCRRFLRSSRRKDCYLPWTTRQTSTAVIQDPSSCLALVFDTETTDRVKFSKPYHDECQPDLVQLGMLLVDTQTWQTRLQLSMLIQPPLSSLNGDASSSTFIHPGAEAVHGISNDDCRAYGLPLGTALRMFQHAAAKADCLVAHNIKFDRAILETAFYRQGQQQRISKVGNDTISSSACHHNSEEFDSSFWDKIPQICTMEASTDVLKLPKNRFGKQAYKWPTLEEAFRHFAPPNADMPTAHDAMGDAEACRTVFRGLLEQGLVDMDTILLAKAKKNDHTTEEKKTAISADITTSANSTENLDGKSKIILPNNKRFIGSRRENKTKTLIPPRGGELKLKILNDDKSRNSFAVLGNTYKYREFLKAEGARWDRNRKAWIFDDIAMLDTVQARLSIKQAA